MKLRGNPRLKVLDRKVLGALIWIFHLLKSNRPIASAPQSVLLIKLNALGDTILFLAVARLIKEKYPGIRVDFLGSELNFPVLERCPYLDRIHVLKLSSLLNHPGRFFSLLFRLRRLNYSAAIDGSQWERLPALIAMLSGARVTIGFSTPGHQQRSAAFQSVVPHRREIHEIDCFFRLLEPLGIRPKPEDRKGEYQVKPEDRRRLESLRLPQGPWIVMHPGCGNHGQPRQWPVNHYIQLANRLQIAFPGHSIILTGQGDEGEACRQINVGMPVITYNLANSMDFHLTGALLEKASLLICGNTGIMHLGAALEVPLIALHGPTDPHHWGPLSAHARVIQSSKSCVPCLYLGYEYNCQCPRCMEEISVEEVFNACYKILRGNRSEVNYGS
jgi:lipopolysaccharide heptosyltransferase II